MKKFVFYIITTLTLFVNCVNAQEKSIDLDDIYPQLATLSPTQAMFLLMQFQKQHPENSNVYVQIGNICEMQIKEIDPLREQKSSLFWADNALLYYGLYANFAQKGDVGRYRDYYANIKIPTLNKKINDEDVAAFVKQRIDSCKNYKKQVSEIFTSLEQSKEHYGKAINMYTQINNKYQNMNELLLHTNDSMLNYLDTLQYHFTLSEELFKQYKNQTKLYPIKNCKQSYTLKNIETYRLDGLTSSDFLATNFTLWDYNEWLKSYLKTYNTDIMALRNEIDSIQNTFNQNILEFESADTVSAEKEYKTYDDLFLFRLGRYDNASIIKDLFKYNSLKQKFLQYGCMPISSANDSSLDLQNSKLRYYYNLTKMKDIIEKEAANFETKIAPEKVSRFNSFFTHHYSSNLNEFADNEKLYLKKIIKKDLTKLKSYLNNKEQFKKSLGFIAYKNDSIALFANVNLMANAEAKPKYITERVEYYRGAPAYLSGYNTKDNNNFIAKIVDNKLEWIKFLTPINNKVSRIFSINLYTGGCIVLYAQTNLNTEVTMLNYNSAGKIIFQKTVANPLQPIAIKFNEIENSYALISGKATLDTALMQASGEILYDEFTIQYADSMGNILWQTPVKQKGKFVDIYKSGNAYQAFFNAYLTYNETNTAPIERWGLSVVNIAQNGIIELTKPLIDKKSFSIHETYKVSSNQINLIGYWGNSPTDNSGNLVYLIVNDTADFEFANFNVNPIPN